MREAGSTLVQEVAFALADAVTYVQAAVARGIAVDRFAPRFTFDELHRRHQPLRGGGEVPCRAPLLGPSMREHFGAERARELGRSAPAPAPAASQLTAQQPENNTRPACTLDALAAILGGPSRCTPPPTTRPSRLPTERSDRLALRTQQVLACEAGLTEVIDPLAVYYVEALDDRDRGAAPARSWTRSSSRAA